MNQKQNRSYLEKLDVFGVEISLKYEDRKKFTSKCGGLITFIVVCVLLSILIQESPNVVFQQIHVDNPSRYNLTPNQFSLMVALLKDGLNPYIDEEIYTVEAYFHKKEQIIQQDGSTILQTVPISLKLGKCDSSDFKFKDVSQYFLNIDYSNCYCIKDQSFIYLQGQFEKDQFTDVQFKFKECIDPMKCKDQTIRENFLKVSKAQIYFTNRILQFTDYENPFKAVGKTIFYNIFYDYFVTTGLLFTNTYLMDDNGLFLKEYKEQKQLVFQEDRQQLASKSGSLFFQCTFYLEKDREDRFIRSYKKIPDVVSQIGGIFNVLFFIGSLIVKPYNSIQLQRKLYQDIFSTSMKQKQTKKKFTSQVSRVNATQKIENAQSIIFDINTNQQSQPEKKGAVKNEDINENLNKLKGQGIIQKMRYLMYSYLRCFQCCQNDLTRLLDLSQSKLDYYTNIKTLIGIIIQLSTKQNQNNESSNKIMSSSKDIQLQQINPQQAQTSQVIITEGEQFETEYKAILPFQDSQQFTVDNKSSNQTSVLQGDFLQKKLIIRNTLDQQIDQKETYDLIQQKDTLADQQYNDKEREYYNSQNYDNPLDNLFIKNKKFPPSHSLQTPKKSVRQQQQSEAQFMKTNNELKESCLIENEEPMIPFSNYKSPQPFPRKNQYDEYSSQYTVDDQITQENKESEIINSEQKSQSNYSYLQQHQNLINQ